MSKQSVTQGIATYLDPSNSNIPNLGTVYIGLPRITSESDLYTNTYPGADEGALIYLFIKNQSEKRIALGGAHLGNKFRVYDLGMLVVFKAGPEIDTSVAQTDFDGLIDALTEYIQANRNPNAATSDIFQWGEGEVSGGTDIQIDYVIPHTIKGGVLIFQAVLSVKICEILNT
jgi:hypothetical protein